MAKTVAQLIVELQKLPPGLEVLTQDCCYGYDDQPEATVLALTKELSAWADGPKKNYVIIR